MSQLQLLLTVLTGPAFALLALLLYKAPALRPRMYTRSIGWLAGCMCMPMIAGLILGLLFRSSGFVTLAFFIKPITALLGVMLFIGYLTMWRSKRFPTVTLLPSVMILLASVADIYAVRLLSDSLDGGQC